MGFLCKQIVFYIVATIFSAQSNAEHVVCYFGSWADYRNGVGKFQVEDIDPTLCTHIIYSFVGLDYNADFKILDPADINKFPRFVELKKRNPEVKTMIAIGGWNDDPKKYSDVFKTESNRALFAKNAISFMQKYGFDGLDLDWEYPARRGGVPSDKQVFTELVKTLKQAFKPYKYLLTAAVSAAAEFIPVSYEPEKMSEYLDFINVMTYDFHSGWESLLGHNAPLYAPSYAAGTYFQGYNVDTSIKAWLNHGVPPSKLVVGIPIYSQTFRAKSDGCVKPGCANFGPGWPGTITQQDGILAYYEVCAKESMPDYTRHFDDKAKVPYLTKSVEYYSFDDQESVQEKVNYILSNKLGGAMVWSIDTDDFRGNCGKGKYPILTVLKNGMTSDVSTSTQSTTVESTSIVPSTPSSTTSTAAVPSSTTPTAVPSSTTSTAVPSTTTSTAVPSTTSSFAVPSTTTSTAVPSSTTVKPSDICTEEGYVRDPQDCSVFYYCQVMFGSYVAHKFSCPHDLVFDTRVNVCNFPSGITGC